MRRRHPLRILVTAGATREPIDPARFISNYSTGQLGYTLARVASRRGHKVTLVSGITSLKPPRCIKPIYITTTKQLQAVLSRLFSSCDCLVMALAVGDFRSERLFRRKVKQDRDWLLRLTPNPDILAGLAGRRGRKKKVLVGFALESVGLFRNAQKKLKEKNLDLIVANRVTKENSPFGPKHISPLLIYKEKGIEKFIKISKPKLAAILLDRIEKLWYAKMNLCEK